MRKRLLTTAAVSLVIGSVLSARQPNIVFIFADDVGRDAIGCYGGQSYETPNIDRLAKEGMRFDHFYAAPVCHPSRIMVMTGKYPSQVGWPGWGSFPKEAEENALARMLQRAGYATAIAGKWQLVLQKTDPKHPERLGFDESCLFGWHEGPRFWSPYIWQNGERRTGLKDAYGPEVYVDFLKDFMKRNREKPFFAFYSMALCHAVADDFKPRPPHGPDGRYMTYAEMVADMDKRVGDLVSAVDELGLAKDTLILFATDNGTTPSIIIRHEGDRLIKEGPIVSTIDGKKVRGGKGSFSDWGIRVPAIAVWPEKISPGSTSDALIDLTDLYPTFRELAGVEGEPISSYHRSFAELLTGGDHRSRDWICVQSRNVTCVRTRDWKLVNDGKLFDLREAEERGPIEQTNDTEESAAARERLAGIVERVLASQ